MRPRRLYNNTVLYKPFAPQYADRIAVEQELLAAAAEKSEVTMRPNASQGEVNWAMGALPAIAPCNSTEVWISSLDNQVLYNF